MLDKQKQNEAREALQYRTLKECEGKKHILLRWATGTSKTLMAIKIAVNRGAKSILLNVKETNHKITWENEFKKWGFDDLWKNVTCICYASLEKEIGKKYDVIINDECHGLSELRETYLDKIEFGGMISLSATPGEDVERRLFQICPYWESNISIDTAIELGILPEPKVYIVDLILDDIHRVHTIKKSKFSPTRKVTQKKYYEYLNDQVEKWQKAYNRDFEDWQMFKMLQAGNERKRFMANCKNKKAKEILEKIKHKRFICFTGSIEQCEFLGGKNIIHSKISQNRRVSLIEKLNNYEISNIFSVNMLKESMNISNIEAGMMIQCDKSTDRGAIQAIGRSLRGEEPKFYFFRLLGTKDEKFVEKAISSLNKKYIHQYEG